MPVYYTCNKCGDKTKATYKESPNYGSHYTVKCECGNSGNSGFSYEYDIDGFERVNRQRSK